MMGPFVITLTERDSGTRMLEFEVERFEHHRDPRGDLLVAVRGDYRGLVCKLRREFRPASPFARLLGAVKRFTGAGR